jgi:hypothetical protein
MTRSGRLLSTRQNRLVLVATAAGLVLAMLWGYRRMSDSRDAANTAAAELAECQALAGRIESLRSRPAVAGVREARSTDVSRRVEQAARDAEFADGSLERIEPEPPRRVGDTEYKEVPTQLRLRRVTLRQVFAFLHAVGNDEAGGPPLRVRSVRLSAPRGEEATDLWAVEATLVYLVYDPKAPERTAGGVAVHENRNLLSAR